jgi:hypothetical protein
MKLVRPTRYFVLRDCKDEQWMNKNVSVVSDDLEYLKPGYRLKVQQLLKSSK